MAETATSVVVVGASAGGVEPLKAVAASLPDDFPAAVAVVLHVPADVPSRLPEILARAGALPATHALDGEPLCDRHIYVAPPDRHLIVADGRLSVVRGPAENGVRPAIDPLFRSAATAFSRRVVAVLLSGTLSDGVAGALAVSSRGGHVIVQDPAEAEFPGIPANTIAHDHPDWVVPAARIGALLVGVLDDLGKQAEVSENGDMALETRYSVLDGEAIERHGPGGTPSGFGCPTCGGALWEIDEGALLRFRCRVGHAFGADDVIAAQSGNLDHALWVALRALLERAEMCVRVAERSRASSASATAERFDRLAREAFREADTIRNVLLERHGPEG